MDPAFALLLASSMVGAIAAAASRIDRLERIGLVLFHVVIACVGAAGALASELGARGLDDGRALIASAAGPFVALLLRVDARRRHADRVVSAASASLLVVGIGAQASLLVRSPDGGVEAIVTNVAAVIAACVLLRDVHTRHRGAVSAQSRSLARADGLAAVLLLTAAVLAIVVRPASDDAIVAAPWALALAASTAWATAARAGRSPPDRRDVATVLCGVALAALVVPQPDVPLVATAVFVSVAFGRSVWLGASGARRPSAPSAAPGIGSDGGVARLAEPGGDVDGRGLDDGRALATMTPVYADGALRGAGRPRVLARTAARRILDAAVDRSQRARSPGDGRVVVEIVAVDADVDVDGDPVELAEAIGSLLDTAMRGEGNPHRVVIFVRTNVQSVSFELAEGGDTVASALQAPLFSSSDGAPRPDAALLAARARLVIERHGGSLLVRPGPRGPVVHVTLPRRVARAPIATA